MATQAKWQVFKLSSLLFFQNLRPGGGDWRVFTPSTLTSLNPPGLLVPASLKHLKNLVCPRQYPSTHPGQQPLDTWKSAGRALGGNPRILAIYFPYKVQRSGKRRVETGRIKKQQKERGHGKRNKKGKSCKSRHEVNAYPAGTNPPPSNTYEAWRGCLQWHLPLPFPSGSIRGWLLPVQKPTSLLFPQATITSATHTSITTTVVRQIVKRQGN